MVKSATPKRVLGYARLSSGSDESTSIARQHEIITKHAASRGWDLIEIIEDPVASASKLRLNRPGLTRVRKAIASGEASAVVVWRLDRIARSVVDFGTLLDEGVSIVSATEPLDTTTPMGRAMAEILQVFAAMEARAISIRISGSVDYLKRNRRFPGGVVPFGYDTAPNPDGAGRVLVVNRAEAAIVREVADRIIGDQTVHSISMDLNRRKVPTTRSNYRRATIAGKPTDGLETGRWTSSAIQMIWTSDNLLGRVAHKGDFVRDPDGLPAAIWEPVLDLETLTRIRAHTRNPRDWHARTALELAINPDAVVERTAQRRRRAARLLSGVAYCAHCDSKMHVNSYGAKPVYACSRINDSTCSAPRMTAEIAERMVEERFLAIVGDHPELEQVETVTDPGTREELAVVEATIGETSAAFANRDADRGALLARLDALQARRETLNAIPSSITVEARPTGRSYREAYSEEETVAGRRRVLLASMDHVTISSLAPGAARKGQHPERLSIVWAESPGEHADD